MNTKKQSKLKSIIKWMKKRSFLRKFLSVKITLEWQQYYEENAYLIQHKDYYFGLKVPRYISRESVEKAIYEEYNRKPGVIHLEKKEAELKEILNSVCKTNGWLWSPNKSSIELRMICD